MCGRREGVRGRRREDVGRRGGTLGGEEEGRERREPGTLEFSSVQCRKNNNKKRKKGERCRLQIKICLHSHGQTSYQVACMPTERYIYICFFFVIEFRCFPDTIIQTRQIKRKIEQKENGVMTFDLRDSF